MKKLSLFPGCLCQLVRPIENPVSGGAMDQILDWPLPLFVWLCFGLGLSWFVVC